MSLNAKIEREVIVHCNWLLFGLVGLSFMLEGGRQESFLIGLIGVASIVFGFIGHFIANYVFEQGFTKGEVALGLGTFAGGTTTLVLSWMLAGLSDGGFTIGLALLAVLVVGFFVYVATRYGVRGAFTKFDVVPTSRQRRSK